MAVRRIDVLVTEPVCGDYLIRAAVCGACGDHDHTGRSFAGPGRPFGSLCRLRAAWSTLSGLWLSLTRRRATARQSNDTSRSSLSSRTRCVQIRRSRTTRDSKNNPRVLGSASSRRGVAPSAAAASDGSTFRLDALPATPWTVDLEGSVLRAARVQRGEVGDNSGRIYRGTIG